MSEIITVSANIKAPVIKVWEAFTTPSHITQWNAASEDWYAPSSENDLQPGGKFKHRMEARDGSMGFDFEGVYTNITEHELMEYEIADGRKVSVHFVPTPDGTKVVESFEAENVNPVDMQQAGWQAILDNFKKYVESL